MTTPSGWYQAPKWAQKLMSFVTVLALAVLAAGPLLLTTPSVALARNDDTPVKLCHTTGSGWQALTVDDNAVNGHLGHGDFLYSGHDTFNDDWCANHAPKVVATKVVCDSESDLPNWGDHKDDQNHSVSITSSTATNWVSSHPNCHLASGWQFQWAPNGTLNVPDQNSSTPAGSPWTTVGLTDANGQVSFTIPATSESKKTWFREVLQNGYIPFSGDTTSPYDDVSAEMYCNSDVLNYDNYDFIQNAQSNHTYYCVAFNVQKKGTLTIVKNTVGGDGKFTFNVTGQHPTDVVTEQGTGSETLTLPVGTYDVTENVPEGWTLTPLTEDSCQYEHQASGNVIQNGKNITIEDNGDNVTCTFVNTLNHGSLKVIKHVDNDAGGSKNAADFSFTVDTTGPDVQIAEGSEDGVSVDVPNGAYSVTETQANSDNYETHMGEGCEGTMTPGAQNVCVITNTYVPPAPQCDKNALHTVFSDTSATFAGDDGSGSAVAVTPTDVTNGAWTTATGGTYIWSTAAISNGEVDNSETFTQHFTIVGTPNADATLKIAADNFYSVSVNGHDIDLGAGMLSDNNFTSAATYNVPQADLLTGDNVIVVHGKNEGVQGLDGHSNPAGVAYSLAYSANECDTGATCVADVNLLQNPSFEAN